VRAPSTGHHTRRCQDNGAAAVEFAVVFPLLVAVLFGLIDGGRLMSSRVMLTYAVSKAARVASLSTEATPDEAAVEAAITGTAMFGVSNFSVTTYSGSGPAQRPSFADRVRGDKIAVHAEYLFSATFVPSFQRTLKQTSWVVVE
jgi:Flp pilus assembly protein TadG